jgi:hypothetical protein
MARPESVAPANFARESNDLQGWQRPMLDGTLDVLLDVFRGWLAKELFLKWMKRSRYSRCDRVPIDKAGRANEPEFADGLLRGADVIARFAPIATSRPPGVPGRFRSRCID